MTRIHPIRFAQALVLAAIVAALAAPGVAFGEPRPDTSSAGAIATTQTPDWFERYATAHPYANTTEMADWVERYAAAHPYGAATAAAPDWIERYAATHPNGTAALAVDSSSGGFDWANVAVGAGMGVVLITLLGGVTLVLVRRRDRMQAT